MLNTLGLDYILVAIRPCDSEYDIAYYTKHEPLKKPHINIKDYVNNSNKKKMIDMATKIDPTRKLVVYANDCIWYPGVFEFIQYACKHDIKTLVSNGTYSPILGKHKYYDNEGHFTITLKDKKLWI